MPVTLYFLTCGNGWCDGIFSVKEKVTFTVTVLVTGYKVTVNVTKNVTIKLKKKGHIQFSAVGYCTVRDCHVDGINSIEKLYVLGDTTSYFSCHYASIISTWDPKMTIFIPTNLLPTNCEFSNNVKMKKKLNMEYSLKKEKIICFWCI